MEDTLRALNASIESISALEESVHKEPQPANSQQLAAQIVILSKHLEKVYEYAKSSDSALMAPVPLELVDTLDGLREGPDAHKKRLLEEGERALKTIGERASFLKLLERKVSDKLNSNSNSISSSNNNINSSSSSSEGGRK